MNPEEQLLATLRAADAIIGYSPIGDEPSFGDFLKQNGIIQKGRSVIADKNISPHDFAREVSRAHEGEKICILIPGREFDSLGTRHGKGGGWYDKFLSEVSREWTRVGVLQESQLSPEVLKRESWDEPVDYLLVMQDDLYEVIKTGARI